VLPPDNHVHTRWSWDTDSSVTMEQNCARAVDVGLPAVAFTEHVDFTVWADGDPGAFTGVAVGARSEVRPFDVSGYCAEVARCRDLFPDLKIWAGIEAGEPHLFAAAVHAVLRAAEFDRVLGSLHAIEEGGELLFVGADLFGRIEPRSLMKRYLTELLVLVEGSAAFGILAHCDYPRRYWPVAAGSFDERDFEEEYRTVFRALASSGRALEVNTRSPLASVELLRWWWQSGGDAVSFGSDAHDGLSVGRNFDLAVDIVEAAGFRPGRNRFDFWRR
jgi:histidinol-phosphatase (PHP family)